MTALISNTPAQELPQYTGNAPFPRWQPATWEDYIQLRDELALDE